MPIRTNLFLRCAIAGILGGLLLVLSPELGLPWWHGLVLLFVGLLSLAIWFRGLTVGAPRRPRRRVEGPTFEVDDPTLSPPTTTTGHLIREVRENRQRQRRAQD